MDPTSLSLLERLRRPGDVDAWGRFVRVYAPLLFHWARRTGLQEADAADLVQDVFAVLVRELPGFRYREGGNFRGWLRTILMNRWRALGRAPRPVALGEAAMESEGDPAWLAEAEERDQLLRQTLLELESDFEPSTWQAFRRTAIDGEAGAVVAGDLGLSVNAVYIARSRVLKRLREELRGLFD